MWEVHDEAGNSVSYTPSTLLQLLSGKLQSHPANSKADIQALVDEMSRTIPQEVLIQTAPVALIDTAFRLGYLYGMFVERNNVVSRPTSVDPEDKSDSQ